MGAGWNACRQGHGKQALTEEAPFQDAKKAIRASRKSVALSGLAKYVVPECIARFPVALWVCGGRGCVG